LNGTRRIRDLAQRALDIEAAFFARLRRTVITS